MRLEFRVHAVRDLFVAAADRLKGGLQNGRNSEREQVFTWCVLPNHYHALVEAPDIKLVLDELGLLQGRTSHARNGEEQTRGRKVFFRAVERAMRSDRHYWATLNHIHHNPLRHGYTEYWTDWPWSSAT